MITTTTHGEIAREIMTVDVQIATYGIGIELTWDRPTTT